MAETQIQQQEEWENQHYQQAVTAVRRVWHRPLPQLQVSPVEVLDSSLGVREVIREKWERYRSRVFAGREQQWIGASNQSLVANLDLWNLLKPYHTRTAALELHLVSYQEPTSYVVSPVSVILSVNQARPYGGDNFIEALVEALETLASQ